MGTENELTDDIIDIAVEDNLKKGIEEMQKYIMDTVNRGIKNQAENSIKEAFMKFDTNDKGEISYEQFNKVINIYLPKIRTVDVYFLAKRYCLKYDDGIVYEKFLDEIDLIDRGINPLMSWAESLADTIVKAIAAQSTDFETLFRTFAPGKNYLTEDQFVKAMKSIRIDSKFDTAKIMKFYYFIDDNKNEKVEFREMESVIKTHCTKTPQKLMDEVLDSIKLQMDEKKIKIKEVYKTLDDYSRNDLIDTKDFTRALTHDLKFHIDEIDLDFACKYYKDKRDKRSIRYSSLMDDLKQKFQYTETYVVPGQVRKDLDKDEDILQRTFSRKDFTTPKKDENINMILKEVSAEAHEKKVDLEKEFKR
jgi:Ca2+-binding EF-hand superfamily protein